MDLPQLAGLGRARAGARRSRPTKLMNKRESARDTTSLYVRQSANL